MINSYDFFFVSPLIYLPQFFLPEALYFLFPTSEGGKEIATVVAKFPLS